MCVYIYVISREIKYKSKKNILKLNRFRKMINREYLKIDPSTNANPGVYKAEEIGGKADLFTSPVGQHVSDRLHRHHSPSLACLPGRYPPTPTSVLVDPDPVDTSEVALTCTRGTDKSGDIVDTSEVTLTCSQDINNSVIVDPDPVDTSEIALTCIKGTDKSGQIVDTSEVTLTCSQDINNSVTSPPSGQVYSPECREI